MPLITDLKKDKETSKIFKKKSYRPWDNELLNIDNSTITESNTFTINENKKLNETTDANIDHFTIQDLQKELRNLFGAQKIVMQYLLNQIEENKDNFVITKCVCMDDFAVNCDLPRNTIKAMLQKLKFKGLLKAHENKPGRGGYARYKFIQQVYTFFSENLSKP